MKQEGREEGRRKGREERPLALDCEVLKGRNWILFLVESSVSNTINCL